VLVVRRSGDLPQPTDDRQARGEPDRPADVLVRRPLVAAIAVSVEAMRTVMGVLVGITVVVGTLIALAGLLFALQGFGVVSGSPMSNTTRWSVLGPIIALAGIAIAFAGWHLRKR